MQMLPECAGCLERLIRQTASLATSAPALQQQAADAALAQVRRESRPGAIPALLANRFHRTIAAITGNDDPFAGRKSAETALLARLARDAAPRYGRDLASLFQLAVLGNAVDFFRDEAEVSRQVQTDVEFAVNHLPRLHQRLAASPGLLLYLADNAGEQHFDQFLLQGLRGLGWQVVYVVKGGPIQNDLTRADLVASGLAEHLKPVADTGARTVGLALDECSVAFRELYARADLIVAKGMGHFETMSHLGDPRVFFLLQAKCRPVAQALGVPHFAFALAHAADITLDKPGEMY
jgi:hypothetical protein